ncbi:MurR/RpiR family transcriptional regulator [Caldicoprobacter algeriensis]|uniref:MurR/RpiR family transcriptional regulator n=1 Tax=Caldicoprobacter algeriensis TaxID=699281 RepID=UPI00207B0B86|nr:MurR/RpiR family transcriptional regulator [Caldicoprobacter algeriensis]MCM8901931.1 MurR/RpiR family transcriptional regulator [Caldicoprobacter algeriensis]
MAIKISEKSLEMIPHNCIVKLQAIYDTLKTAEKKVADLLLEKPDFFANATIVEVADEAGCSEATIVHLARKLGYSGYHELKSILIEGRKDNPTYLYKEITEGDSYEQVIKKVFRASIHALEDTLNVLDMGEYKRAVDAICNAQKIVLCGVGDAATVARSGYLKFFRIGLNVQMSDDLDVQLMSVSHLSKGDVVIAISHTGKTKSILEVVKYAKAVGATIICITNYPVSPLAKHSDIVLLTATFAEHVKGEVISKRVAELCIIESLYVNILLNRKDKLAKNLDKSNLALELNKV